MGDAGEALIDAESRIQERMEEVARERASRRVKGTKSPEHLRAMESLQSLQLARTELQRQYEATAHDARRAQLTHAIGEVDRRITEVTTRIG